MRLPPRLRPLFPYLKPVYVAATAAAAPLTVRLSARRDGFLPAGAVPTLAAAAASSGGRATVVRPAEQLQRPAMLGRPSGLALADPSDGESVGAVGAAELPHGRVLGPHRAVITGANELVFEVSRYFGTTRPTQHPLFLQPHPAAPLEVEGRLGVLAARGDANYYHFLHDVLPRIELVENSGFDAVDRWYVPATTRFQRELLELLGLDAYVDADAHPHVRADCLVVPGLPAPIERNPPWVSAFLRRRLLPSVTVAAGPDIYVTRGAAANNRSVLNEADLLTRLTARGFVAVDPGALSVREQIAAFAGARRIVAPHGAALANLAFASPGSAVIELFPAGCLLPDFWRLACGIPGLSYRYLSAPGGPRRPTRAGTITRNIEVDLEALERLLDDLG